MSSSVAMLNNLFDIDPMKLKRLFALRCFVGNDMGSCSRFRMLSFVDSISSTRELNWLDAASDNSSGHDIAAWHLT